MRVLWSTRGRYLQRPAGGRRKQVCCKWRIDEKTPPQFDHRHRTYGPKTHYWMLIIYSHTRTESSSDVQLKARLPLFERCQDVYKWKSFDGEQFCAGGGGADTCRGDSGSPLMLQVDDRWFAYGIVSHGPVKCGSKGLPGVYTNVSFYFTWIERKVNAAAADWLKLIARRMLIYEQVLHSVE